MDPDKVGTTAPTGTHRVYLGTVESVWTCSSCGHSGIPGSQKKCPNCGNPKGVDEEYQHPNQSTYLSSAQLDSMGVDPKQHFSDELCPHCGAKLKPGTQKCPNCGGAIDNAAYAGQKCPNCGRETVDGHCPSCGALTDQKQSSPPGRPHAGLPALKGGVPNRNILVAVALAILVTITLALIFWPREKTVVVHEVSWSRTIQIEEYQYNRHGGWALPQGADYISDEVRFHNNESVYDHTEVLCHDEWQQIGTETETYTDQECSNEYSHTDETCYDDGTCDRHDVYETVCHDVSKTRQVPEYGNVTVCDDVKIYRDEPRYATWYTYDVWEWVRIDPLQTHGMDSNPTWPAFSADARHREASRDEEFEVSFVDKKGKTFSYRPATVEEFQRYRSGSDWKIKTVAGIDSVIGPN